MATTTLTTIGHNNPPPPNDREKARAVAVYLQDRAADLLASHPEFRSEEALGAAGELKRDLEKASKNADAARRLEKQPHDDAGKEVQKFWVPLIARMDAAATDIGRKMLSELARRKTARDAEEQAARDVAQRLSEEAVRASEAAFIALDDVSTGVATEINHLEARAAAEAAHAAAKEAAAEADRIAKTTAGIKVAGAQAVHVKVTRRVRLALPRDGTREQRAAALLDFVEYIETTSSGPEMLDAMSRCANQVYRSMKFVPPHCEEYDEQKVV